MKNHAAEVSLSCGTILCGVSLVLDGNPHQGLWQQTEWLLLFYWVVFGATIAVAARFAFDGRPGAGSARPFRIAAGVYAAFAGPIVFRAAWLLFNFHGNTGAAEGMGWIPLNYPASLALSMATGLVFLGQLGRGGVPVHLGALAGLLLGVQHLPHVALYLAFLPPFGPAAPASLANLASVLVPHVRVAGYATGVQLLVLMAIMHERT